MTDPVFDTLVAELTALADDVKTEPVEIDVPLVNADDTTMPSTLKVKGFRVNGSQVVIGKPKNSPKMKAWSVYVCPPGSDTAHGRLFELLFKLESGHVVTINPKGAAVLCGAWIATKLPGELPPHNQLGLDHLDALHAILATIKANWSIFADIFRERRDERAKLRAAERVEKKCGQIAELVSELAFIRAPTKQPSATLSPVDRLIAICEMNCPDFDMSPVDPDVAFKRCLTFISKDDTRKNLIGVHFREDRAIGCDGHRMITIPISTPEWWADHPRDGKVIGADGQEIEAVDPGFDQMAQRCDDAAREHQIVDGRTLYEIAKRAAKLHTITGANFLPLCFCVRDGQLFVDVPVTPDHVSEIDGAWTGCVSINLGPAESLRGTDGPGWHGHVFTVNAGYARDALKGASGPVVIRHSWDGVDTSTIWKRDGETHIIMGLCRKSGASYLQEAMQAQKRRLEDAGDPTTPPTKPEPRTDTHAEDTYEEAKLSVDASDPWRHDCLRWNALVEDVRTGELDPQDKSWHVSIETVQHADGGRSPRAVVVVLEPDGYGMLYGLDEPTKLGMNRCMRRVVELGVPRSQILRGEIR